MVGPHGQVGSVARQTFGGGSELLALTFDMHQRRLFPERPCRGEHTGFRARTFKFGNRFRYVRLDLVFLVRLGNVTATELDEDALVHIASQRLQHRRAIDPQPFAVVADVQTESVGIEPGDKRTPKVRCNDAVDISRTRLLTSSLNFF
jgi:hypothetical protein